MELIYDNVAVTFGLHANLKISQKILNKNMYSPRLQCMCVVVVGSLLFRSCPNRCDVEPCT